MKDNRKQNEGMEDINEDSEIAKELDCDQSNNGV